MAFRKPAAGSAPAQDAAPAREPAREEVRPGIGHNQPPRGRAVAIGRDGQPIWRHGVAQDGFDKYAIPADMVPPGWVYQWKAVTVLNEERHQYIGELRSKGWTPVMADVHPGRFMPLDHKGPIIMDGLMLMETPYDLWEEASNDEKRVAADKVNRARANHGLAPASNTVATDTLGDRRNTFVRSGLDTGADIPRPKYDRQPIE